MVRPVDDPQPCDISVASRQLGDGVLVIGVGGVIDLLTAPRLTETLGAALVMAPRALIIDLTDVDFLSAAGLGVLVSARRDAGKATTVMVVADGHVTRRPIVLTGVDQLVPTYFTVDQALSALDDDPTVALRQR